MSRCWLLVFIALFMVGCRSGPAALLPTLAVVPTDAPTETATPSQTATASSTLTPSPTATVTPSVTPTATPILATRVLVITAIHPDVLSLTPAPSVTPTALPTLVLPTPALRLSPLPSDGLPPVGWYHLSVDHPALHWTGQWDLFTTSWHSVNRRYRYTNDPAARVTLRFLGAGVRLRYVKYMNYGVFQVRLDERIVATLDTYLPRLPEGGGDFVTTQVFALSHGWHTLEVIPLLQKNPASGGTYIAIDGVDVYANGLEPTLAATVLSTLTASPASAVKIEVIAAPPTIPPTPSPVPPRKVSVSLVIAYDENNNKVVDPAEGVAGVSVRLVTVTTNRVVASGFTDAQGYAALEVTTEVPLRLVVPYFSKVWEVPYGSAAQRFTLLLPAANLPGLIP